MTKLYKFHCDYCKEDKEYISTTPTGFIKYHNKTICFGCYTRIDIDNMRITGKGILRLHREDTLPSEPLRYTMRNLGTLRLPVNRIITKNYVKHSTRRDIWFDLYDQIWHGVQYGDFTQLCHCRRLKQR